MISAAGAVLASIKLVVVLLNKSSIPRTTATVGMNAQRQSNKSERKLCNWLKVGGLPLNTDRDT